MSKKYYGCYQHFVNDAKKIECDCEMRILKNRTSIDQWYIDSEYNIVNFSWVSNPADPNAKIKKPIVGFSEIQNKLTENKSSQISVCSSCNYSNEYIDYDPNYKCLKCRKGW
jgi:hypothetical protein